MNLILFADGFVGLRITKWLLENYLDDLGLIVTAADSEINKYASNKGLPNLVFRSEEKLLDELAKSSLFDLGILAWWPTIISTRLLSLATKGFFNTHPCKNISFILYRIIIT